MVWLSDGEKIEDLFIRFDGPTDTARRDKPRFCIVAYRAAIIRTMGAGPTFLSRTTVF